MSALKLAGEQNLSAYQIILFLTNWSQKDTPESQVATNQVTVAPATDTLAAIQGSEGDKDGWMDVDDDTLSRPTGTCTRKRRSKKTKGNVKLDGESEVQAQAQAQTETETNKNRVTKRRRG